MTYIHPDNMLELTKSLLWPLNLFCTYYSRDLPQITPLFGQQLPEPYKQLLIHRRNMTSTLETFYDSTIHIECLNMVAEKEETTREVILRLDTNEKAVEYGASRIFTNTLPKKAVEFIDGGKIPLGTVLKMCKCEHTVEPSGFFRIKSTQFFADVFSNINGSQLYGRRNTLVALNGEPIAEVCEILPPADKNNDTGANL